MAPPDKGAAAFLYPPTSNNIEFFAQALRAGALVAIPTETVYGLAANADLPSACRAVFMIKGRPLLDPLIVHFADLAQVAHYAVLTPTARTVAERFWPGPLTMVLQKTARTDSLITAGRDTVAVRMPAHPVAQQLIAAAGIPLAAPSANPFGYVSPTTAQHVVDSFGAAVPFVIDGGPTHIGIESTILDLSQPEQPRILRPGAISAEAIAACIDVPVAASASPARRPGQAALAPGTLESHYCPNTPLHLVSPGSLPPPAPTHARIFLKRPLAPQPTDFWFSESGQLTDIAHHLFALLRQLDRADFSALYCELPPATGIGIAIRDRLRRAAAKFR